MTITGGCYCQTVRYEAEGDPVMRGLCLCHCHCRECQYISGGAANVALAMPNRRYISRSRKSVWG